MKLLGFGSTIQQNVKDLVIFSTGAYIIYNSSIVFLLILQEEC